MAVADELLIREITPADADRAAALSGELGYPATPEAVKGRIELLKERPDQVVFVACVAGEVLGWIDVCIVYHLAADPRVEIAGLVVSGKARSQGIGAQLVARAETWARERGVKAMLVRSQIVREAAHRFYLREGYARTKTSAVFTKHVE